MNEQNNKRMAIITPPQAILDNDSWTTTELDKLDSNGVPWEYCNIYVILGATDIALTALKVTESDTSGSGHADVTGLIYGTSVNTAGSTSTLPSATDDNKVFEFQVDLRKRKRFLDLVATIGDGSVGGFICAWAEFSRQKAGGVTASERGVSQTLRV